MASIKFIIAIANVKHRLPLFFRVAIFDLPCLTFRTLLRRVWISPVIFIRMTIVTAGQRYTLLCAVFLR